MRGESRFLWQVSSSHLGSRVDHRALRSFESNAMSGKPDPFTDPDPLNSYRWFPSKHPDFCYHDKFTSVKDKDKKIDKNKLENKKNCLICIYIL